MNGSEWAQSLPCIRLSCPSEAFCVKVGAREFILDIIMVASYISTAMNITDIHSQCVTLPMDTNGFDGMAFFLRFSAFFSVGQAMLVVQPIPASFVTPNWALIHSIAKKCYKGSPQSFAQSCMNVQHWESSYSNWWQQINHPTSLSNWYQPGFRNIRQYCMCAHTWSFSAPSLLDTCCPAGVGRHQNLTCKGISV